MTSVTDQAVKKLTLVRIMRYKNVRIDGLRLCRSLDVFLDECVKWTMAS